MKSRFASRKDINQPDIEAALERAGYRVWSLHRQGFGIPDLLVLSKSDVPVLLEVKQPGEDLTPKEKDFFGVYTAPVYIVETAEAAIGAMEMWDAARIEMP